MQWWTQHMMHSEDFSCTDHDSMIQSKPLLRIFVVFPYPIQTKEIGVSQGIAYLIMYLNLFMFFYIIINFFPLKQSTSCSEIQLKFHTKKKKPIQN